MTHEEARINFNWGFWDGVNDAEKDRLPVWWDSREKHFNRIYVNGYEYGREATPEAVSSDAAWTDFLAVIREAAKQRAS